MVGIGEVGILSIKVWVPFQHLFVDLSGILNLIFVFQVTSKPDLYPLVISYNTEPVTKNNNSSTGYLMVQYFRNFIVRPVGKRFFG